MKTALLIIVATMVTAGCANTTPTLKCLVGDPIAIIPHETGTRIVCAVEKEGKEVNLTFRDYETTGEMMLPKGYGLNLLRK